MPIWEDFEIQCTDFLNNSFGAYAQFFHQGGADATIPDILVQTNTGKAFYMDAKHSPAQCGQFVLLPDLEARAFVYSRLNVNRINASAEMIIDYMNHDFDAFREAGTAGRAIDMPDSSRIFADWIIQTYKEKGVVFFITNNYTILPIEHFLQYFYVSAKYRIKRSGSSNVGKRHLKPVMDYIKSQGYSISSTHIAGDKLFVASPQQLHHHRFLLCGIEYMFSLREDMYELRRLSNTYHANVIFSITQKNAAPGMSEAEFIACLK